MHRSALLAMLHAGCSLVCAAVYDDGDEWALVPKQTSTSTAHCDGCFRSSRVYFRRSSRSRTSSDGGDVDRSASDCEAVLAASYCAGGMGTGSSSSSAPPPYLPVASTTAFSISPSECVGGPRDDDALGRCAGARRAGGSHTRATLAAAGGASTLQSDVMASGDTSSTPAGAAGPYNKKLMPPPQKSGSPTLEQRTETLTRQLHNFVKAGGLKSVSRTGKANEIRTASSAFGRLRQLTRENDKGTVTAVAGVGAEADAATRLRSQPSSRASVSSSTAPPPAPARRASCSYPCSESCPCDASGIAGSTFEKLVVLEQSTRSPRKFTSIVRKAAGPRCGSRAASLDSHSTTGGCGTTKNTMSMERLTQPVDHVEPSSQLPRELLSPRDRVVVLPSPLATGPTRSKPCSEVRGADLPSGTTPRSTLAPLVDGADGREKARITDPRQEESSSSFKQELLACGAEEERKTPSPDIPSAISSEPESDGRDLVEEEIYAYDEAGPPEGFENLPQGAFVDRVATASTPNANQRPSRPLIGPDTATACRPPALRPPLMEFSRDLLPPPAEIAETMLVPAASRSPNVQFVTLRDERPRVPARRTRSRSVTKCTLTATATRALSRTIAANYATSSGRGPGEVGPPPVSAARSRAASASITSYWSRMLLADREKEAAEGVEIVAEPMPWRRRAAAQVVGARGDGEESAVEQKEEELLLLHEQPGQSDCQLLQPKPVYSSSFYGAGILDRPVPLDHGHAGSTSTGDVGVLAPTATSDPRSSCGASPAAVSTLYSGSPAVPAIYSPDSWRTTSVNPGTSTPSPEDVDETPAEATSRERDEYSQIMKKPDADELVPRGVLSVTVNNKRQQEAEVPHPERRNGPRARRNSREPKQVYTGGRCPYEDQEHSHGSDEASNAAANPAAITTTRGRYERDLLARGSSAYDDAAEQGQRSGTPMPF